MPKLLYKFENNTTKMTKKILLIVSLLFVSIAYSQEKWTLKKCVEYALENNISIKQNALNISLSERDVAITQGNFLPSINASSSGGINSGLSPDRSGVLKNTKTNNPFLFFTKSPKKI